VLELTYQILFLGSPLFLVAIAHGFCMKYDWLSWLKRPLDLGGRFRGRRIFGDQKTWRGLTISVVFCTLGTLIQAWLQGKGYLPPWILLLDYRKHRYIAGILLGLGMTVGELPNSFIKRQLDIPPGMRKEGLVGIAFFLFDQVDLTMGIWIFLFFLVRPSLLMVSWSFLLTFVLHVAISSVGYLAGMRKTMV
jgi:hypothetical protein